MIILENVSKAFGTGEMALSGVNLTVNSGEFVFFVGPSGSGKTTLLRMLIRDVLPTQGRVIVNEWDLTRLPSNKIPHLRKKIGVVFQDLKLLSDRTIYENIFLPLHIAGIEDRESERRVNEVLEQVGIPSHKDKYPIQLSGGELQRAAIARALVFSPDILLADEPTGNLDMATSWEIVKLLQDINKTGTTILMATHNTDIVNNMLKRVITLEKGKLTQDSAKQNSDDNNTSVSHSTLKDELSGSNSISSAKVTAAGESDEREGNTEPIKEVESPKEEKEKKLDPKQIEEKMASLVEEFATEKPSETKNEHKSSHKHKVDEVKEEKKEEKE